MTVTQFNDSVSERDRVSAFPKIWDIAPIGFTGRSCPACKSFFTAAELEDMCTSAGKATGVINCLYCGTKSTPRTAGLSIRQDSTHLLDETAVVNEFWYHATLMDNWHNKLLRMDSMPLVHLGTFDAALARAKDLSSYIPDNPLWNVYQVKISTDAAISPVIIDDDDTEAPSTEQKNKKFRSMGYQLNGVTRYVNRFESEGSISLIANPRVFYVVGHRTHN